MNFKGMITPLYRFKKTIFNNSMQRISDKFVQKTQLKQVKKDQIK